MLIFCQITDPISLWEKIKNSFSEDIIYNMENQLQVCMVPEVYTDIYNKFQY